MHAFVLWTSSGCVVVDTGVGGFGPYRPWVESYAGAWAGVEPAEVGHVVLTHLHADHAGGTVGAGGAPRFPNAVYHVHPADWEHFTAEPDPDLYDARLGDGAASSSPGCSICTRTTTRSRRAST